MAQLNITLNQDEMWDMEGFPDTAEKRGLMMIMSDAHDGTINASGEVFQDVPWQRCQFHFSKNIADKVPKKMQAGLRAELQEMLNSRIFSISIEMLQLLLRLGTFQLSDIFYNPVGGVVGGLVYYAVMKVRKCL